jgi:hypothetical protein
MLRLRLRRPRVAEASAEAQVGYDAGARPCFAEAATRRRCGQGKSQITNLTSEINIVLAKPFFDPSDQ